MAELGVIASGMGVASLAMQIGQSIMKLKSFVSAVKEAPEDIRYMIEKLESLSLVFEDLQIDEGPHSSASMTKCLHLCRRSADKLRTIVKDLEDEIDRRRLLGGVKSVLRKNTLEKLKDRLEDAQNMLMLSNQACSW